MHPKAMSATSFLILCQVHPLGNPWLVSLLTTQTQRGKRGINGKTDTSRQNIMLWNVNDNVTGSGNCMLLQVNNMGNKDVI